MKKWLAWTLVLTLLIGMFVFREWIISREGFDPIRAMDQDYGWLIFHRERVPRMEADQLIAADGMLFLHYEKYGYVNVYSADGTFLRGYQVACGGNGKGGMVNRKEKNGVPQRERLLSSSYRSRRFLSCRIWDTTGTSPSSIRSQTTNAVISMSIPMARYSATESFTGSWTTVSSACPGFAREI